MKSSIFVILFFGLWVGVQAQTELYNTKQNISYYADSVTRTDAYLKERCVLDVYYPKHASRFATVVWFHGGGLGGGNKFIPEGLKNKGIAVVAVNYRLDPKVHAPSYIEDAAAAVAWVFKHINAYGGDSTRIFVSGHSAGAYLSLMIGLDKQWLNKYEIDANRIAGLIPLSGQTITHFTIRKEMGLKETQPLVDKYAPLYWVRADAAPLLLITGDRELELLGRYEENAYLMRMMKIAGHTDTRLFELQGYDHGMTDPAIPLLLNEIKRVLDKRN